MFFPDAIALVFGSGERNIMTSLFFILATRFHTEEIKFPLINAMFFSRLSDHEIVTKSAYLIPTSRSAHH
jgi:hypothetical protein